MFRLWRFLQGTLGSPWGACPKASPLPPISRGAGGTRLPELMWLVSCHHKKAEVLCSVTCCLAVWWRSLWLARVSYRKLLLEPGLGGLPGLPPFEQRQPIPQPCPLPGGQEHAPLLPLVPGLLPACATAPGWGGTRDPAQVPENSHKRRMRPPRISGSLKQGQLSSQPSARCFSRPVYCINVWGENLVYGSYRKSLFLL